MAAYAVCGIAPKTSLCAELIERNARLRDLSVAEERDEGRNDGLDLRVSFDDPLERVDAAVTLDPAHPSECALQAMKNLRDYIRPTMLCRRRSYLVPARTSNAGVRSDKAEASLAVEKSSGPSQVERSAVDRVSRRSFEQAEHLVRVTATTSERRIRCVLVEETLHRVISLNALYLSEVIPDERDRSDCFEPTSGDPFIEIVSVGTDDPTQTADRVAKTDQDGGNAIMIGLRHRDFETQVARS